MATTERNRFRRHPWLSVLLVFAWIGLTIFSNTVDREVDESRLIWGNSYMDAAGAEAVTIDGEDLPVSADSFEYQAVRTPAPMGTPAGRPPILLIHGTPGGASGFAQLAPEIARAGHEVIWLDLPGFASQAEPPSRGSVFQDYSADAYAHILWRVLDELNIERAHLLGWSNGGAVALRMIEQQPDRAASLVMLASVGVQETEGSGSYFFEHAKYKLGELLLVKASPFYPHFGIVGPASDRHAFIRNFDDTDQRDMRAIMASLTTPTLIIHGRHDFLVSDWAAEAHHEIIPTSSLVMTPYDHFMPFLKPKETAGLVSPFITRHDTPDAPIETGLTDLAPRPKPFGNAGEWARNWLHNAHWSLIVIAGTVLSVLFPRLTAATLAVLVGSVELDIGVASLALVLGGAARLCLSHQATSLPGWLGVLIKPQLVLAFGVIYVPMAARPLGDSLLGFGWLLSILLLSLLLFVLRYFWTTRGRQHIIASAQRTYRYEFWPAWLFYLPVLPALVLKAIKHGPLSATCCNPGISQMPGGTGGGIVGESKADIQHALPEHEAVLTTTLIQPGDGAVERTLGAIESYPVILKPNAGQRGFGVRLIRNEQAAIEYASQQTVPFVVQAFHPGPNECGIFWCRDADNPETGFIYGITAKTFPILKGDGKHTLEQLIWKHPRYRMQAGTILERFDDQRGRVLAEGEQLQLTTTGNHAQGTLFFDGSHLITPELTELINSLALNFKGPDGGGFDIGRFDVRYTTDDDLRAGKGLGIVELNGLTAESANMYDPSKNLLWAYRVLLGQWEHAYRLGKLRRKQGAKPVGPVSIYKATRGHYNSRGDLRTSS